MYVWDTDGKKYIDMIGALGANLLGYGHPAVKCAVRYQLEHATSMSLPSPLEVEVAEMIQDRIPCAERIRFLKTGNEATLAAVRIARTYAPNNGAVVVTGYHGHGDLWTWLTPPRLGIVDMFSVHADTVSAKDKIWITEPLRLSPEIDKRSAETTEAHIRIFDEIITGFRVPKYCVANWWNLQPDLICLGKGLANGLPLSIVAGKKEVMNCGEYFISSTFSGEATALAAAKAVMEILNEKLLDDMYFYGMRLQDRFNELCEPIGTKLEGYGTRAMLNVSHPQTQLLMQEACKAGLLLGKAWFYSLAHLEEDAESSILPLVADIVHRIKGDKVRLEGRAPVETFKR